MRKLQKYGDSDSPTTWSISNFKPVLDFWSASPDRSSVLVSTRPGLLNTIFGPKHQTWIGGSENHRFSVWRVDAEGLPIWILCGKPGTTYEPEHPGNPWDGSIAEGDMDKVVRFLARTYLQLEDLEPIQKYGPIVDEKDDPILRDARNWLNRHSVTNVINGLKS